MSITVALLVYGVDIKYLDSTQTSILARMALYGDEYGGSIYPSYNTLAFQTKLTRTCVIQNIKEMEARRVIAKTKMKRGSSNSYKINLNLLEEWQAKTDGKGDLLDKKLVNEDYQGGTPGLPPLVNQDYQGGKPGLPKSKMKVRESENKDTLASSGSGLCDSPNGVDGHAGNPISFGDEPRRQSRGSERRVKTRQNFRRVSNKSDKNSYIPDSDNGQAFSEFWECQEWRESRKDAREEFDSAVERAGGGDVGRTKIITQAQLVKQERELNIEYGHITKEDARRFAKRPLKWLQGNKWEDEIEMPQSRTSVNSKSGERAQANRSGLEALAKAFRDGDELTTLPSPP